MRGSHLIWTALIVHFITSPFYYARWGLLGLIPDFAGLVFIASMARLLIRSEMKKERARIEKIDR